MTKLVKEKIITSTLNEEIESNDLFILDDGWDHTGSLDEIGLMDWLDRIERISYEIKNARRGSYAINGSTAEDLLNALVEIHEELGDILENIESNL